MPPLPRIRAAALAELAKQLRFVPRETLRKQLARVEELAAELDPAGGYPEDWVAFRITGFRGAGGPASVLTGSALLADLSAFAERLTAHAPEAWGELPAGSIIDAAALGARWRVSRKTIERCRRKGLIAHRVRGANGRVRLAFPVAGVERFESRHAPELAGAGAFSRIDPHVERRMIRRAGAYRRKLRFSLNRAAQRLAAKYERSLEAVRQVLRRHEARSGEPIFAEPGPPSARERRVIVRAARHAIEPGDIAERFGRSTTSIRRVITDERAAALQGLGLAGPGAVLPWRGPKGKPREDALEHEAARADLGAPGETDLLAFIEAAREQDAPDATTERARAAAYHALVARAAAIIAAQPEHGASASAVDEAETRLRWAARLKAELVRTQWGLVVRTIESGLGRPPEQLRSPLLLALVRESLAALAEAVDQFRPGTGAGGRLAAPAGLAMTRVVARFAKEHAAELRTGARATPRLGAGVQLPDWTRSVAPWQAFLEPDPRVRAGLAGLDERVRAFLAQRFGWGGPARTLAELAGLFKTTVIKAAILERKVVRAALSRGAPVR
ncbi:MAG: hypothetical protein ACKVU4_08975 [Phycisphaerales bacterium]